MFQTRRSVRCDPSVTLLHGLLTLVQPAAPISALGRPFVHSAPVEDVVRLVSNATSYSVTAACLSLICLCPGVTKRAFCLAVMVERLLSVRVSCYQPHVFSCCYVFNHIAICSVLQKICTHCAFLCLLFTLVTLHY